MMLQGYLWLILLLPSTQSDQSRPHFLSSPRKPTTAYAGTNIRLEWRYFVSPGYVVKEIAFGIWRRPGYLWKKLISIRPGRSPQIAPGFERKISWTGSFSSSRAAFVLNSVNKKDEDSYGIQVEFGIQYDSLTDWFNLRLQEPARITSTSGNVSVTLGETLNITCEATGIPAPSVLWRKANVELSNGSGRTHFVKDGFTTRDVGVYTCVAMNNITDKKDVHVSLNPSGPTSGSYSETINTLSVLVTGLTCAYKIMS